MSFTPYGIHPLSHVQEKKLLQGEKVRCKKGTGHTVHLTSMQCRKLAKAHEKGGGSLLSFSKKQISHNLKHAGNTVMSAGKNEVKKAEVVLKKLGNEIKEATLEAVQKVKPIAMKLGSDASEIITGKGRRKNPTLRRFENTFKKIGHVANQIVENPVVKNIVVPVATQALMAGMGMKKRRGRKKQNKEEYDECCHGGALNPAGGALYPAGYSGDGINETAKRIIHRASRLAQYEINEA